MQMHANRGIVSITGGGMSRRSTLPAQLCQVRITGSNFSLRASDNSCFQIKLFHTIGNSEFGSGWKEGEE